MIDSFDDALLADFAQTFYRHGITRARTGSLCIFYLNS
jgi:hypothetical protein